MDAENKTNEDPKVETKGEDVEKLKERLSFLEAESKKAFDKRDEYKKQIEAIKQKEAEEKGEIKELYGSLKTEHEKTLEVLEGLKAEKEQIVEEQRKELLEKLDDEGKEFAQDLDLAKLRAYVKLNAKKQAPPVDTGAATNRTKPKHKSFRDWKAQNAS